MGELPAPPNGAKSGGIRLWESITAQFELEEHELAILRQMVRTIDEIDILEEALGNSHIQGGNSLVSRVNPIVPELRQQRILLARLTAALRLPDGLDGMDGKAGGALKRPARRTGPRGPYVRNSMKLVGGEP